MTDLSRNASLRIWFVNNENIERIPMNGGSAITGYRGTPLIADANVDTTYAVPFTSSVTAAAGDVFLGIAVEPFEVETSHADGEVEVLAYVYPTILGFQSAVFGADDLGDTVYMDDSGTLTATGTGNLKIGKLHKVADGYCYVELAAPYVLASADVA